MVTLQLRQLHVPAGQHVLLEDVDWLGFVTMVEELGDHRGTRLAYSQGRLVIMSPSPEHEKTRVVLSDLIKVLLDELDMPWESLGSTTLRREDMAAGVEPDDCFYIQHQAAILGKHRLDLTMDPPPDLVLEVDVTSATALHAYAALQVPEIWRYAHRSLQIFLWHNGRYAASVNSPTFPGIPVIEGLVPCLDMSRTQGTVPALRAFRHWVRSHRAQRSGGE